MSWPAAGLQVLVVLSSLGCLPVVPLGSDFASPGGRDCNAGAAAPTVTCPEVPWGDPLAVTTAGQLQQRVAGRWTFCGGERRFTGRGPTSAWREGANGIDFEEAPDGLHFWLVPRTDEPSRTGVVRLSMANGHASATLVADDGIEATWDLQVFDSPRVLRNVAFDVWNFVPSE